MSRPPLEGLRVLGRARGGLPDQNGERRHRAPAGLDRDRDGLVAQVIAVANESFRRELGVLSPENLERLDGNLRTVSGL